MNQGKKYKVLVIDDEPYFREVIILMFRETFKVNGNCEFIEAINGADALDKFKSNHIDFIITDLVMPQINGIELIKLLTNGESYPANHIIIITGLHEDTTIKHGVSKLGIPKENFFGKHGEVKSLFRVKTVMQQQGLSEIFPDEQ